MLGLMVGSSSINVTLTEAQTRLCSSSLQHSANQLGLAYSEVQASTFAEVHVQIRFFVTP